MRILFLTNLFPPNVVGGYEVLCCSVAADLAHKGHEVSVLTSSYGAALVQRTDMTVIRGLRLQVGANIYAPFDGTSAWGKEIERANEAALHRVLSEFAPHIVFCWNLYGLASGFFDVIQKTGSQVVVMLTDNWLLGLRSPQFLSSYFENSVMSNKETPHEASLKRIDVNAIFGSNYMRDLYRQGGMEFKSSVVVHNGVRDLGDAGAASERDFSTQHTKRLLFAGRLVRIKGIETAIEAVARVNSTAVEGDRYQLTIVGSVQDSAYMSHLRSMVEATGRAELFEFLPTVPESDLVALFKEHDAYLFPSLYEPFSLTLIHAMQSGIPVIASDAGGNPEIVEDGVTGILFERGDAKALSGAILKLFAHEELRREISIAGRERAQNFSFAHMIDGMESYLSQCAGRG